MSDRESSSQWTKAAVLKHVRDKGRSGEPVSVQVFLDATVPVEGIDKFLAARLAQCSNRSASEAGRDAASRLIDKQREFSKAAKDAKLGKVSRLARSINLKASREVVDQDHRADDTRGSRRGNEEDRRVPAAGRLARGGRGAQRRWRRSRCWTSERNHCVASSAGRRRTGWGQQMRAWELDLRGQGDLFRRPTR